MRYCLILLAAGACAMGGANDAASLRLVPFPKEVTLTDGGFDLPRRLVLQAPKSMPFRAVQQSLAALQAAGIRQLSVSAIDGDGHVLRIGRAAAAQRPAAAVRKQAT